MNAASKKDCQASRSVSAMLPSMLTIRVAIRTTCPYLFHCWTRLIPCSEKNRSSSTVPYSAFSLSPNSNHKQSKPREYASAPFASSNDQMRAWCTTSGAFHGRDTGKAAEPSCVRTRDEYPKSETRGNGDPSSFLKARTFCGFMSPCMMSFCAVSEVRSGSSDSRSSRTYRLYGERSQRQ